jgi:hypothetical protein
MVKRTEQLQAKSLKLMTGATEFKPGLNLTLVFSNLIGVKVKRSLNSEIDAPAIRNSFWLITLSY